MNEEMCPEQKLDILVKCLKDTCDRLCNSAEPGITDLRYFLEDALISIGVEPYKPYPELIVIQRDLQDRDALMAMADDQHFERVGW